MSRQPTRTQVNLFTKNSNSSAFAAPTIKKQKLTSSHSISNVNKKDIISIVSPTQNPSIVKKEDECIVYGPPASLINEIDVCLHVGHTKQIEEVRHWVKARLEGKGQKSLFLEGSQGCGKTHFIQNAIRMRGLNVKFFNEEMLLPKEEGKGKIETIPEFINRLCRTKSHIVKETNVIVFDYIEDYIHEIQGVRLIINSLPDHCSPIVFIASDMSHIQVRELKQQSKHVRIFDRSVTDLITVARNHSRMYYKKFPSVNRSEWEKFINLSNGNCQQMITLLNYFSKLYDGCCKKIVDIFGVDEDTTTTGKIDKKKNIFKITKYLLTTPLRSLNQSLDCFQSIDSHSEEVVCQSLFENYPKLLSNYHQTTTTNIDEKVKKKEMIDRISRLMDGMAFASQLDNMWNSHDEGLMRNLADCIYSHGFIELSSTYSSNNSSLTSMEFDYPKNVYLEKNAKLEMNKFRIEQVIDRKFYPDLIELIDSLPKNNDLMKLSPVKKMENRIEEKKNKVRLKEMNAHQESKRMKKK